MKQTTYLIWLIAALVAISCTSTAQAQYFGISPAEVRIDDLSPGDKTEFRLSIRNRDEAPNTFNLSTFHPQQSERREGRDEFPDGSWISFSPQRVGVEVEADSDANVEVSVAIPSDNKWAGKDWEIWLRVAPEDRELLVVNYYVRLLVSTGEGPEAGPNITLIIGIVIAVFLLGYAIYYSKRRAKAKQP
jgi:hypothetical protein